MKLGTAQLVATFAVLVGTMGGASSAASTFGGGKPRARTTNLRKLSVKTAPRQLQVMDLPLNETVQLPSPFVPPDALVYSLPAQGDFVQLHCFTAGNAGDVDLEVLDADTSAVLCESAGPLVAEECTTILFPDQPVLVNIVPYANATDAEFGCELSSIAEVTIGEDVPVVFADATPVSFYYAGDALETLKCSISAAPDAGGDIELYMYAQSRGQFPEAWCRSVTSSNNEECTTVSFAEATSIVTLTPFNETVLPSSEVTLNCRIVPTAEVSLGVLENVTFEDGDALFAVVLEEAPSLVICNTYADGAYNGDVDLEMYALGNSSNTCVSASGGALESCNVMVDKPTTVIIKVALFLGDPLAAVGLSCFAGPVTELTLGESIPLDLKRGDVYTFNFYTEEAPSQVVCEISSSNVIPTNEALTMTLESGNSLLDQRISTGQNPVHLGVFYEGQALRVQLTAYSDLPPDDVALECSTQEVKVGSLEWGVPTYLNVSMGEAVFFPIEFESNVPSDIVCMTAATGMDHPDIDLSLSPIGAGFEKTLGLGDINSTNSLIWPWSVAGTTFHVLVEEYSSSKEVMVQCNLVPLDELALDEQVTFSEADLMGNYKLRFLADMGLPTSILNTETAKVFHIEATADVAVECSLTSGEDVFPELLMYDVDENGRIKSVCSSPFLVPCSLFSDSGHLFVSAILSNATKGPDTEMALLCTELDVSSFPEEDSPDEAADVTQKDGPET